MPQTDSDREGIVIALPLDGKGSARQVGWPDVEDWKPEHGALWLQLDKTSPRTCAWLTSQGESLATLGIDDRKPRFEVIDDETVRVGVRAWLPTLRGGAGAEGVTNLWLQPMRAVVLSRGLLAELPEIAVRLFNGTGPKTIPALATDQLTDATRRLTVLAIERGFCEHGRRGDAVNGTRSVHDCAALRSARLAILAAALIGAWSMAVPARAQAPVAKILVIHNADSHDPARAMVDAGILSAAQAAGSDAVDFSFEYVDLQRFASEADAALLARQLGEKYAGVGLRAIVAVTDGALAFLRKHELFQGVPTVAFTEGRPPPSPLTAEPNVVRVWAGPTAVATIELALRLHPSTRQVVVLSGKPYNDGEYEREVREQLAVFRGRVDVTFLTDPEPEQALTTVKNLPPDAVVLILRLVETPRGNRDSREAGLTLSNASPVPFYTVKDTRVGYGVVGGFVGDTTAAGSRVGAVAIRLALGTPPGDIPSEQQSGVPMFDWRQLRRWGISESRLPVGSAILYRPPGIWELYRGYLIAGGLVLGIQTSLIGALMLQRARRRGTELALRESQRRYALATSAGALGVWDWNFETNEIYVDPVLKSLLGFADAEITSRPEDWGARVHPQDATAAAARIQACVNGDSEIYDIEHRMLHKDGSAKWFLSRGSAMRRADGTLQRLVGTKVDITERKRAEENIRESEAALQVSHREIQHLAGRLIEAQDAERARVARELHDDVSQQLAALAIAVSGLRHHVVGLPGSGDVQRDLRALQERTVTLSESVRHLSHDLHPSVLQHVGLVAALTEYCAELSHVHDVVMTCTAEGDFESLAPEAALCFYRIAQEALRNVVAHAGASVAEVRLRRLGDNGELTIADDGKGFALAGSHRSGKGLGLVSITERVRLAGGTLSVVTELKKGTRLRAQIPVSTPARCEV